MDPLVIVGLAIGIFWPLVAVILILVLNKGTAAS